MGTLGEKMSGIGMTSTRTRNRMVDRLRADGIRDELVLEAMNATPRRSVTVEASRLLGATVIVTGLSPEIAQTLVTIGVELGKMNTVGDLQGGIEEAERLLGYKVSPFTEVAQQPI